MFKAITRFNSEFPGIHTKCGEIHFQNGNWHYCCALCGLITLSNDDLLRHLKSKHFLEFMSKKNMFFKEKTTTVKTSKKKLSKLKLDDPLLCSPKEEKCETDIVIKNTENELTTVKDFHSPILETNAKMDEQQNSKTVSKCFEKQARNASQHEHETPDGIDHDESYDETKGDPPANDEISDETESLSDNGLQNESEIDWSTPFKPLKNREKRPYRPRKQPFTCPYCGCKYRRRYQFDAHMNTHTGAKPFLCEICARQFRAIATLKNHLVTHGERFFVCSYCNKTFSHKPAMLTHEKRHTQERNKPCDLCEKQFYTCNQLDTHKRRVHKKFDGELPFACDLCPKRYRTNPMLSIHKSRIHNKTLEIQCEICQEKFANLQRLEGHSCTC